MYGRILVSMVFAVTLLSSILIFYACSESEPREKVVIIPDSKFQPDCEELLLDSLIADGVKICSIAQRYYHKSIALGGGGNSFEYFAIPVRYDSTVHGTFAAPASEQTEHAYKLIGTSFPGACDNEGYVIVEFIATPDDISAYIRESLF